MQKERDGDGGRAGLQLPFRAQAVACIRFREIPPAMGLACFDDPEANEEYFDCEEDEEMQGFAGMLPPDEPAPDPGPCLLSLYIQVA